MAHFFNMQRPVLGVVPEESVSSPHAFQPLPSPTGAAPYRLDIKTILTTVQYNFIVGSKKMSFHTIGDTGGVKSGLDQVLVAQHMEMQFDKLKPLGNPSFFYHLGDIVYYYGKDSEYNNQFYEPYQYYPAPIFGIPGNHDGDVDPTDKSKPKSLAAFVKLFCAKKAVVPPEAGEAIRTTMVQPNVYWTLVTPVANIIGLYTNVPGGGEVKANQQKWFINELKNAAKERATKAIVVTLHHPPYSMDAWVGASDKMQQFLDGCFNQAGVIPDIVLSGHVHNYQRFTRQMTNRQVPYIVAGAGGYYNLHSVNLPNKPVIKTPCPSSFKNVKFEKYSEDRHGFLLLDIDMQKKELTGQYYTVPRLTEPFKTPPVLFDVFTLDLTKNKLK